MKKYVYLIIAVVLFIGGLFSGYKIFKPASEETKTVNSEIILTSLQQEGFLVTQTYVLDERVEIEKGSGSSLKDFFFGQTIAARANIKVGVGVDLGKMKKEDIEVKRDSISIDLPAVEIKSTEILGDVSLENKQGILKKIFDNEDGYNEAVDELKKQARLTTNSEELWIQANDHTEKEVMRLIRLVDEERKIDIKVK